MIPILTAFECSPDRGRGLARDMRVRWALEETASPTRSGSWRCGFPPAGLRHIWRGA